MRTDNITDEAWPAVPSNVEAEAFLLGGLMSGEVDWLIDHAADKLTSNDFFEPVHGRIFDAILKQHSLGKPSTPVFVKGYFENDDGLAKLGGLPYLARLTSDMACLISPRDFVKQVSELSARRKVMGTMRTAYMRAADLNEELTEVVGEVDTDLDNTSDDGVIDSDMDECLVAWGEEQSREKTGVRCSIIPKLDGLWGPLEPSFLAILAGRPGMGKAQPFHSKVLTIGGWKKMGEIQVGDQIASVNGDESVVTGVFPQGIRQVYRVTFSDGRSAECCGEHLWKVRYRDWPAPRILSTDKVRSMLACNCYKNRLSVDLFSGEFGNNDDLPVDPWLLGFLLGDGCMRGGGLRFSTPDQEIVDRVRSLLPDGLVVHRQAKYDYRISGGRRGRKENPLVSALRALGVYGSLSFDKHIPSVYMAASREMRIELLRGLMDSDGWAEKHGTVRIGTSSKDLANGICDLVRSIGGICSIRSRTTFYTDKGLRKDGRVSFTCRIRLMDPSEVFSLKRKKERAVRKSNTIRLNFTSIEPTKMEEVQCISVSHPDHLYVTDEYVVTHNTAVATNYAVGCAQQGHGVSYISLEMNRPQLVSRMISHVSFDNENRRVDHDTVKSNHRTDRDQENIDIAMRHLASLPMRIVDANNLGIGRLERIIRKQKRWFAARGKKLELVVVDYLQLLRVEGPRMSGYDRITEISMRLKGLAKSQGLAIVALSQLSREVEKREDKRPVLSDLRESGQIEQDADCILFLLREEYYLRKMEPRNDADARQDWEFKMDRVRGLIELILAKNRHGPEGTEIAKFLGPYQAVR